MDPSQAISLRGNALSDSFTAGAYADRSVSRLARLAIHLQSISQLKQTY